MMNLFLRVHPEVLHPQSHFLNLTLPTETARGGHVATRPLSHHDLIKLFKTLTTTSSDRGAADYHNVRPQYKQLYAQTGQM